MPFQRGHYAQATMNMPLLRVYVIVRVWCKAVPTRPVPTECATDEFRCDDGTCIDLRFRCDQEYHCPDASDEFDCRMYCHWLMRCYAFAHNI